jgi:hypothetical protein
MSEARRTRLACWTLLLAASGAVAQMPQDENDTVLATWGETTGAEAPLLVDEGDGTTRLEWTGRGQLDLYVRDAAGDALVTPYSSGGFYAAGVEGQWRGQNRDGRSWLQLAATSANDRALLPHAAQLDTFQAGRAGPNYRLTLGDTTVLNSALSTSTALRGMSAQGRIEQVMLSVSAGVIGPSWEALTDPSLRAQPLRNALALKASMPAGSGVAAFATFQGFDDTPGTAPNTTAVQPASGYSATVGAAFTRSRFTLQAETGISRLRPDGGDTVPGTAFAVDATWGWPMLLLRVGHHDFGTQFASLSASAVPGLRESYANGTWTLTPGTALSVDLRDTLNRNAASMPPPVEPVPLQQLSSHSRAATLQLTTSPAALPGTSLTVAASRSAGTTAAGARNDLDGISASATHTREAWSASLGYQLSLATTGTPQPTSRVQGWTASIGRSFDDLIEGWQANLLGQAQLQRQTFAHAEGATFGGIGLQASPVSERWGSLTLAASTARGHDPDGVPLSQHAIQLEAQRPIAKRTQLKLYAAWSDNFPDADGLAYSDTTAGLQINHQF